MSTSRLAFPARLVFRAAEKTVSDASKDVLDEILDVASDAIDSLSDLIPDLTAPGDSQSTQDVPVPEPIGTSVPSAQPEAATDDVSTDIGTPSPVAVTAPEQPPVMEVMPVSDVSQSPEAAVNAAPSQVAPPRPDPPMVIAWPDPPDTPLIVTPWPDPPDLLAAPALAKAEVSPPPDSVSTPVTLPSVSSEIAIADFDCASKPVRSAVAVGLPPIPPGTPCLYVVAQPDLDGPPLRTDYRPIMAKVFGQSYIETKRGIFDALASVPSMFDGVVLMMSTGAWNAVRSDYGSVVDERGIRRPALGYSLIGISESGYRNLVTYASFFAGQSAASVIAKMPIVDHRAAYAVAANMISEVYSPYLIATYIGGLHANAGAAVNFPRDGSAPFAKKPNVVVEKAAQSAKTNASGYELCAWLAALVIAGELTGACGLLIDWDKRLNLAVAAAKRGFTP